MKGLVQDVQYGLRLFRRSPGFAAVAILTLAIGIAANAGIFSVVNAMLLRPYPYQDPDRLVWLDETMPKQGFDSIGVAYADLQDWQRQSRSVKTIAGFTGRSYSLFADNQADWIEGAEVTANCFPMLGISPILGRNISDDEDQRGKGGVALIGHSLWQRRFGGQPSVVGRSVTLNGKLVTIIGVMPPGVGFPEQAEIWTSLAAESPADSRGSWYFNAIGRLAPGATVEQARAEFESIQRNLAKSYPENDGVGITVKALRDSQTQDVRLVLLVLLGAVGFVLLIACVNVANLLLARGTARQRELAIRAGLGAGRLRLMRQLLTESLMLGGVAAVIGLVGALGAVRMLTSALPDALPFWVRFDLDWRVLGYTAAIAIGTSVAFGLAPALQAARLDLNSTLKDSGGKQAGGSGNNRLRSVLVVAEVALATVLLVGAGLMVRSLLLLQKVDAGVKADGVFTFRLGLAEADYPKPEDRARFYRELMRRTSALPGVERAAAVSKLPLAGSSTGRGFIVENDPTMKPAICNYRVVSPGYFRTMGVRLVEGRDFSPHDTAESLRVVVVDQTLARRYWKTGSPVGKRMRFGGSRSTAPWATVIGVAADVRHAGLNADLRPGLYVPFEQAPEADMAIVLRAHGDPALLANLARKEVESIDRRQPIHRAMTMGEVVNRSVWRPRLYSTLFGVFACVALLLASVGVYGVMALSVAHRRQEIGVRMALGAGTRDVLAMMLSQGTRLAVAGLAVGLAASYALTRFLKTLLYVVSPTDGATFAGIALLLLAVSMLAVYIPARRAARLDPALAIKGE